MKRLLAEPLLHFLLIGIGLFLLYELTAEPEPSESEVPQERIVVSAGRISQLIAIFEKTWQRPPSGDELKGLIDDFVLEEAYYRKALAMGIDRDDTIIRRRLRQKLEFLGDDAAALVEPTEQQLQEFMDEQQERFRLPATYSFRQIYFNPEKHGDQPEDYVARLIDALNEGPAEVGDSSLLPERFDNISKPAVDGTFGTGFSDQLDGLAVGKWQGPVRSGLGLHLVRLESRQEGELPKLDSIRSVVVREWTNEQRVMARQAMNAQLLEAYEIEIEWPTIESAGPSPANDEGEAS